MLCISIISNCIVILVNGGWTEWREWSACSISCGGGSQTRFRNCTNPIPANGGLHCSASAVDIRDCVNNGLCSAGKDALPDQFFWFVFDFNNEPTCQRTEKHLSLEYICFRAEQSLQGTPVIIGCHVPAERLPLTLLWSLTLVEV